MNDDTIIKLANAYHEYMEQQRREQRKKRIMGILGATGLGALGVFGALKLRNASAQKALAEAAAKKKRNVTAIASLLGLGVAAPFAGKAIRDMGGLPNLNALNAAGHLGQIGQSLQGYWDKRPRSGSDLSAGVNFDPSILNNL